MVNDILRYDLWIEEALRQVVLRALRITMTEGLPGDHHFYITFRTNFPGVEIPPFLRAQHPDEMTIVLQHQFEDLDVDKDAFSVVLRFNGKPQKLKIPFETVTSFADPSVNFGLQLKTIGLDDDDFEDLNISPSNSHNGFSGIDTSKMGEHENTIEKSVSKPSKTGEVIALDSFRKK